MIVMMTTMTDRIGSTAYHAVVPRCLTSTYCILKLGVAIATGWTALVRFPAVLDLSLLHSVQTGSGAHPASYPMGTGGSFPGCKEVGE
jgi:hypothetical protein